VPTIGSIGWATLNTVADPPPLGAVADAHPASAATAAALPEVNAFLRSMTSVSSSRRCGAEAPCYIRAMRSLAWFFAYFAFSHRSADGEAGA